MSMNAQVLETAGRYVGVKEWPGAKSNPVVEDFFARAGHPGLTDEVPWCAGFVGAVLAECGLPNSGSLMARSYGTYGRKVALRELMPGDIIVIGRGKPPQGHVFFFVRFEGSDKIIGRGGNQGDEVNDKAFAVTQIIHMRRADPMPEDGWETVRKGDSGAVVLNLQDQLRRLGYFSGQLDGDFGPLTEAAVVAFQKASSLDADGIAGRRTREALRNAEPRAERAVTTPDLRARGSRTIKAADASDGAATVASAGLGISVVQDALTKVQDSQGTLEWLAPFARENWPLILVALGLIWIFVINPRIRAARTEDAQTGANLAR